MLMEDIYEVRGSGSRPCPSGDGAKQSRGPSASPGSAWWRENLGVHIITELAGGAGMNGLSDPEESALIPGSGEADHPFEVARPVAV